MKFLVDGVPEVLKNRILELCDSNSDCLDEAIERGLVLDDEVDFTVESSVNRYITAVKHGLLEPKVDDIRKLSPTNFLKLLVETDSDHKKVPSNILKEAFDKMDKDWFRDELFDDTGFRDLSIQVGLFNKETITFLSPLYVDLSPECWRRVYRKLNFYMTPAEVAKIQVARRIKAGTLPKKERKEKGVDPLLTALQAGDLERVYRFKLSTMSKARFVSLKSAWLACDSPIRVRIAEFPREYWEDALVCVTEDFISMLDKNPHAVKDLRITLEVSDLDKFSLATQIKLLCLRIAGRGIEIDGRLPFDHLHILVTSGLLAVGSTEMRPLELYYHLRVLLDKVAQRKYPTPQTKGRVIDRLRESLGKLTKVLDYFVYEYEDDTRKLVEVVNELPEDQRADAALYTVIAYHRDGVRSFKGML